MSTSACTRCVAAVACSAIAAGVGLAALLYWRRSRRSPCTRPSPPRAGVSGAAKVHSAKTEKEGTAQRHFEGVGGKIFAAIPFDEEEEDLGSEDDGPFGDEAFIDGEDAIIAMLDRHEAEAEDDNRFVIPAGTDFSGEIDDDDSGFEPDDDDNYCDDDSDDNERMA